MLYHLQFTIDVKDSAKFVKHVMGRFPGYFGPDSKPTPAGALGVLDLDLGGGECHRPEDVGIEIVDQGCVAAR